MHFLSETIPTYKYVSPSICLQKYYILVINQKFFTKNQIKILTFAEKRKK